mmetsp:Transcript_63789/g.138722  ORF Transcript_63789/g.138722 Transcript_63789/m.138722 type:complete len:207 (+) Transcript_63789:69-689(+)
MDLHATYPHYLEIRKYIGNFSGHHNDPAYTISRSHDDPMNPGRPLPRQKTAADHFGPGKYPAECNFPGPSRLEELPAGMLTRSRTIRQTKFPRTSRTKGVEQFPGRNNPGPTDYSPGINRHTQPIWSISDYMIDSGRPLPREKTAADHIGPGAYTLPDEFTVKGWRRSKSLEKNGKNIKDHWASTQYSHMFKCIKSSSTSVLPSNQ